MIIDFSNIGNGGGTVDAYTKEQSDAKYRTIADSYSKTDIDNKGYITEIPEEYVTDTELTAKDYVDNATLEAKGYITEVPDTYATKEYVDGLVGEANNRLEAI